MQPLSQECLNSWSVQPGTEFTVPVLYHAVSDQYVSVLNRNALVAWTSKHSRVDEGISESLTDDVLALYAVAKNICVVFSDGSLQLVSPELRPLCERRSMAVANATLNLSSLSNSQNSEESVICSVLNVSDEEKSMLTFSIVEDGISEFFSHDLVHPENTASSSNPTSCELDIAHRSLAVSWDDGTFALYQICPGPLKDALAKPFTLKFHHQLSSTTPKAPIHCCFADNTGNLMIAGQSTGDGARKVSFWSYMYGVVLHSDLLQSSETTRTRKRRRNDVTSAAIVSLVPLTNREAAIVVFSDMVWVCPVSHSPPTLASCVSSLSRTAECLHPEQREKYVQPVMAHSDPVLKQLFSHKIIHDTTSTEMSAFLESFQDFWKLIEEYSVSEDSPCFVLFSFADVDYILS